MPPGPLERELEGVQRGGPGPIRVGPVPRLGLRRLPGAVELHPGAGRDVFEVFAEAGFNPYSFEVEYSPLAYDRAGPAPAARRLPGPVEGELDVIFSRADRDEL